MSCIHGVFRRSFKIAQLWIPVNVIFVGMIWTSFFALKNLGVPMATVLKNLTNLFTIGGDYLLYGKVLSVFKSSTQLAAGWIAQEPCCAKYGMQGCRLPALCCAAASVKSREVACEAGMLAGACQLWRRFTARACGRR